jgi:hypothetical protein
MTLLDLIGLFRDEAKDQKKPSLWSDSVLVRYAAEGEAEVARRTRCFFDATTPAICSYPIVTPVAVVTLDPRVLFIRRVKLASQPWTLDKCDQRDLDWGTPGWEQMQASAPCTWFPLGYRQMQLVPAPDANDTLNLQVIRLPLVPLAIDNLDASPEIEDRAQHGLVHWMLYRAYGKQDSQTSDPAKAKTALAQFEMQFGPPSTFKDELWLQHFHGQDQYEGIF